MLDPNHVLAENFPLRLKREDFDEQGELHLELVRVEYVSQFTCEKCGDNKDLKKRCRRDHDDGESSEALTGWICSDCEKPRDSAVDDDIHYFTCFECNRLKLVRHISAMYKGTEPVCSTCKPFWFSTAQSSTPALSGQATAKETDGAESTKWETRMTTRPR